jgi:hypothetical protein
VVTDFTAVSFPLPWCDGATCGRAPGVKKKCQHCSAGAGLTFTQVRDACKLLAGTDYYGGVQGVGITKACALVRKHGMCTRSPLTRAFMHSFACCELRYCRGMCGI